MPAYRSSAEGEVREAVVARLRKIRPDTRTTQSDGDAEQGRVTIDVPVAYYQWLYGIERDVLVRNLTPHEIAGLVAALTNPGELCPRTLDLSQRLQDHMEQHHGVCLKASEWDAAIRALSTTPNPASDGEA